ncbi:cytochrome c family protein [Aureivirga marina]|uniref:hypothetical protein n=1 Tax=Aureivirga marina TaxID=1182451 RepID=UPI0018CB3443|nr:hypothetical protein [Aureivirga marina]
MKKEQKKGIRNLVLIFLFFIVCFAAYKKDKQIKQKDIVYGCRTHLIERKLNDEQKIGRKIFNSYCSVCHKLDKYILGPKLKDVSKNDWLKFQKKRVIRKDSIYNHELFFSEESIVLDSISLDYLWKYLH